MQLHRNDNETEHVLTASGVIGAAELPELRARLVEAFDGGETDVLLDAHEVSAFDDAALPALTAARSRAKFIRRHLVVLDGEDGAVSASLRRSGLRFRFPVYAGAAEAHQGLAAGRAELDARGLGATHPSRAAARVGSPPR
jgi:anti-anti-sigma regulatory factor